LPHSFSSLKRKPFLLPCSSSCSFDSSVYSDSFGCHYALLKILALGSRQIEAGKVESAAAVIQRPPPVSQDTGIMSNIRNISIKYY
jgi:hypothetical protein